MLVPSIPSIKPTTVVAILVSAWLLISAVLFERPYGIFWSDLAVSAAIVAGAFARASARRARLVSWAMAICGVWLVISPWMLGDESSDVITWSCIVSGFLLASIEIVGLSKRAFRRTPRY
jgi:MFS family permease